MLLVFSRDVSGASGAEFEIRPSLSLIEEYNDNIFLTNDNRADDFITRTVPSLSVKYGAPLWTWDVKYAFDYLYYAKGTRNDDKIHSLLATGSVNIIEDKLVLKVSDDYNRVSLDTARDRTRESSFVDLSDRNIFTLNPYYIMRPAPVVKITTGYIYADTWYKEKSGVSKTNNIGFIEPSYEVSPQMVVTAGYRYTREDSEASDFGKHDVYLGSRYEYAGNSSIYFRVGNSWLRYTGRRGASAIFWGAGITHAFPSFTGSLETSSDYIENPVGAVDKATTYLALLKKEFKRTLLNLSVAYTEYKDPEGRLKQTERYTANTNAQYGFTSRTTGTLDLTAERLDDKIVKSYTRRYLVGSKLDYALWKNISLNIAYSYTDSYSPKIVGDKYRNNRIFVGVRKDFF